MLRIQNISKKFGNVQVLTDISLAFEAGKVLALIGENGAGKSTLMKILSGVYTDYEGHISLDNQKLTFKNTKEAQHAGIAIIHQELNLVQDLSITKNLFLGSEICNQFGFLDKVVMQQKTQDLLKTLNLNLDPNTPISKLKIGEQQLVEIAKALLTDAQIIIMDEPTSAISGAEIEALFSIIDDLKKAGKAIVYISHKMDELYAIADNYAILRDGKLIETGEMQHITRDAIVAKMVGREVNGEWLSVRGKRLEINREDDLPLITYHLPLTTHHLSLKKGEILGIFGLMGAGRTELLESIFGLRPNTHEIWIEGQKVQINSPIEAIKHGLALVTEDRKHDGIIPELSVKKNISLASLKNLLKGGILNSKKEADLAADYIEKLSIKTATVEQQIQNLSGGNQQKVILSKWLATNPKILLLDEPTRGIDVNAKAEIYAIIRELADSGMGIIVASSELPEILAICDRVLVMAEGKITADILREDASEEKLLKAAIK